MGASFRSAAEFREVMDRVFALMDEDPEMGPRLRDADVPQRFAFEDLDLVVNVRAARPDEGRCIVWAWRDDVDWEPKVRMTMSSDTANRYFQGKENVPLALARRRIKAGGDVKAALALMPLVRPVFVRYRELVRSSSPHLAV